VRHDPFEARPDAQVSQYVEVPIQSVHDESQAINLSATCLETTRLIEP